LEYHSRILLERPADVLTGPNVILALKIAVFAVTLLFLAALAALARGNYRLHGRINTVFFILTATALFTLEIIIRVIDQEIFRYFDADPDLSRSMSIHLSFAIPAALLMPLMLFTGYTHRRALHLALATVFALLWTGTFVTGVFFLPHSP
jgi:uncharacterized membrane protein YozB (DUF420 family)